MITRCSNWARRDSDYCFKKPPEVLSFFDLMSSSIVGFFPNLLLEPEANIPTGLGVPNFLLFVAEPMLFWDEVDSVLLEGVFEVRGLDETESVNNSGGGLSGSEGWEGSVEGRGVSSFSIWRSLASIAAILSSVLEKKGLVSTFGSHWRVVVLLFRKRGRLQ